jgi:hypothetical protein
MARLEPFREVFLDFEEVGFICQAFADKIFRVFKNNNPGIDIIWVRANNSVEKMIGRVVDRSQGNKSQFDLGETSNSKTSV